MLCDGEKKSMIIGIDLGGTFIKGGIAELNGELLFTEKIPTPISRDFEEVTDAIVMLIGMLRKKANA